VHKSSMVTVSPQVPQRGVAPNQEQPFSSESGRKARRCLACGNENLKPGRRYCSRYCRQKLMWSLSLSKGLLQTLNARYAAFSFNDTYVALDILPAWSKNISRFIRERKPGHPPSHTLKELVLETGEQWYQKRNHRFSRSFASQSILEERVENSINPESIKPNANPVPRLSLDQKKGLKHLNISTDSLIVGDCATVIKRAFRGMAKVYHPDKGGDGEKFKELARAHELMQEWAENPRFRSSHSLPCSWSYNGDKNRWSPPLWR
jgi:hypothetical protein